MKGELADVQNYIRESLQKLGYVSSATLVGRPVEDRTIESVNDFDNIVVVEGPMTTEKYKSVGRVFENVRDHTRRYVDFQYAIADGPMKPVSEKECEMFYHVILHTEESYKDSPLVLVENSWQYEESFLGKPPRSLRRIKGVDRNILINGVLGIDHLAQLVADNESAYLGWEEKDGIMQMNVYPIKFKENDERLELYFYSILRCASNALRYLTGNSRIGIDADMCILFENIFSDFRHSDMPAETYRDKRLLRNKKLVLSENFVQSYQAKTIDFLKNLRNQIGKN